MYVLTFPIVHCSHKGLDHLLYSGRGAGGHQEEAAELHVACFMGLLSFLASRHEVLRVAPTHSARTLDAAVRAIIQTATPTQTPLTDARLDGTGEVIQVRTCSKHLRFNVDDKEIQMNVRSTSVAINAELCCIHFAEPPSLLTLDPREVAGRNGTGLKKQKVGWTSQVWHLA